MLYHTTPRFHPNTLFQCSFAAERETLSIYWKMMVYLLKKESCSKSNFNFRRHWLHHRFRERSIDINFLTRNFLNGNLLTSGWLILSFDLFEIQLFLFIFLLGENIFKIQSLDKVFVMLCYVIILCCIVDDLSSFKINKTRFKPYSKVVPKLDARIRCLVKKFLKIKPPPNGKKPFVLKNKFLIIIYVIKKRYVK